MFRVSLPGFALQHRVEWEADLTREVSSTIRILNHLAWMQSWTARPHGEGVLLSHEAVKMALARNHNAQLSKGAGRVGCAIRITVRTRDSRTATNDAAALSKNACLTESCLLHSGLGGNS
jgi:hypothetical protein